MHGFLLVNCFHLLSQERADKTQSPWPQLSLGAARHRDRAPWPELIWISCKTSPAHPSEFMVTGSLLQNTALTNGNFLMKSCLTERFPSRSDLGACISLGTCRGHLKAFVHKARCSKHVRVGQPEGCLGKKAVGEEGRKVNLNVPLLSFLRFTL